MECAICFEVLGDADKLKSKPPGSSSTSSASSSKRGSKQLKKLSDLTSTQCGHIFHKRCIRGWLTQTSDHSRPCPLCRKNILIYDDLRTVYFNYRFGNCEDCLEWKNDYLKLEKKLEEMETKYRKEFDSLRDKLKNAEETNISLKNDNVKLLKFLRRERGRNKVKSEDMKKDYDTLLKAFQSLLQKYKDLVRKQVEEDPVPPPEEESVIESKLAPAASCINESMKSIESRASLTTSVSESESQTTADGFPDDNLWDGEDCLSSSCEHVVQVDTKPKPSFFESFTKLFGLTCFT